MDRHPIQDEFFHLNGIGSESMTLTKTKQLLKRNECTIYYTDLIYICTLTSIKKWPSTQEFNIKD